MSDCSAITRLLTPLADPVRAVQMQAYMKNRFPFLGIPKPQLKATLKPHLKAAAREGVDWQTIDACWQAEAREYQYAALERKGNSPRLTCHACTASSRRNRGGTPSTFSTALSVALPCVILKSMR